MVTDCSGVGMTTSELTGIRSSVSFATLRCLALCQSRAQEDRGNIEIGSSGIT